MDMHILLLPVWLLWTQWQDTLMVAMAIALPENRVDVIGTYRVSSRVQCQKLCWYRLLCTSFSHTTTRRQGTNCVLHSNHVEGSGCGDASPADWTENAALITSASGGCDDRPCDASSICVRRSDGDHDCLKRPAKCGNPDPLPNSVTTPTSLLQGSKATVECIQDYVRIPTDTSMEIECQVNGRWTSVTGGECVQAVFHNPATRDPVRLPRPMTDVWEACMKGEFTDTSRMEFNFISTSDLQSDEVLHADFRHQYGTRNEEIVLNSKLNGAWRNELVLDQPPMTLPPGHKFTLTIQVTSSTLRLTLNSDVYEVKLSDLSANLSTARFFYYDKSSLDYVNLDGVC